MSTVYFFVESQALEVFASKYFPLTCDLNGWRQQAHFILGLTIIRFPICFSSLWPCHEVALQPFVADFSREMVCFTIMSRYVLVAKSRKKSQWHIEKALIKLRLVSGLNSYCWSVILKGCITKLLTIILMIATSKHGTLGYLVPLHVLLHNSNSSTETINMNEMSLVRKRKILSRKKLLR